MSEEKNVAAVFVDIDSLVPWDKNPRNNVKAIKEVKKSIETFGFASPIIARTQNREIIAGHTRWQAARALGMTTVPVRFLDLSEEQAHALAVADNRLGEIAEWDAALLEDVLKEIEDIDTDLLDATGFADELETLFSDDFIDEIEDTSDTQRELEYRVVVTCSNENMQAELISNLEAGGYKCQALIS